MTDKSRVAYYKLEAEGGDFCVFRTLDSALWELRSLVENDVENGEGYSVDGERWSMQLVWMSEEEYEALGEFTGW